MTLLAVVHIVLTLSVCFSVRYLSFSVLLCPPNPINKYNKTRQRQGYDKTKYSLSRKIVRRLSKAFCLLLLFGIQRHYPHLLYQRRVLAAFETINIMSHPRRLQEMLVHFVNRRVLMLHRLNCKHSLGTLLLGHFIPSNG